MATLDDLQPILESIKESSMEQTGLLRSFIEEQRRANEVRRAERSGTPSRGRNRESTTIRGGVSRGVESGIGGILGGIGAGVGILARFGGAAIGLPLIATGIAGFFTALSGADAAIAKLGDGTNLKNLMINIGDGLESLDTQSMTALGGLLGVTVLWSRFTGIGGMVKAPVGMAAIGLGIGGFMSGVAAAGDISGFTGENFATQVRNMVAGIKEFESLNKESLAALGLLAGIPALVSTASPVMGLKAAVGMSLAGAGIGGFMTGIAAAGDLTGFDGATFAAQAGNVATGLKALEGLDHNTFIALSSLAAAGAIAGATGPMGLLSAGLAATGMGVAGFGLGAFVAGIAAAGDLAQFVGVDGTGLRNTMENLGAGLNAFQGVDGTNLANIGDGLASLGAGMLALFAENAIGGIKETALNAFDRVWSWFTGEETTERKTQFEQIADDLQAFNDKDFSGIIALSDARIGESLTALGLSLKDFPNLGNLPTTNLENFITGPFESLLELKEEYGNFDAISEFKDGLSGLYGILSNFATLEPIDFSSILQISDTVSAFGTLHQLISTLKTGGTIEVPDTSEGASRRQSRTGRPQTRTVRVGGIESILADSEMVSQNLRRIRDLFGMNLMTTEQTQELSIQRENYQAITELSRNMIEVSSNVLESLELLEQTFGQSSPPAVVIQDNSVNTNAPSVNSSSAVTFAAERRRRELEDTSRPAGVQ